MRIAVTLAIALIASCAYASSDSGYGLDVVVRDAARPEYGHEGTVYVEALRGENYELRITNPSPYRVAVALSVDGLNTIDAHHTDSWTAAKWVLGPYESTSISGWQVNGGSARRFFFTGEKKSYGVALGQTKNLGVIEAVFYREHAPIAPQFVPETSLQAPDAAPRSRDAASKSAAGDAAAQAQAEAGLSDEYAGTGMGRRTRHEVQWVDLVLEPQPVATVRLRYEFRPQLVRLGVLPERSPLGRRERARGFASYCPEVN